LRNIRKSSFIQEDSGITTAIVKQSGKVGSESLEPDVLEMPWDRAAQALKGPSNGKLVISFGKPRHAGLDGLRCGFV
jgi:hypothetical protein